MVMDANGHSHKAAGRPDGGQYDTKAGQGSDDDLTGAYVPGMDVDADRRAVRERPKTLSAEDWRVLRHSPSWGVRMAAWSDMHSPKLDDGSFADLLEDESKRVRGAAAYRTDLTERQARALLADAAPCVRRKAAMFLGLPKTELERVARFDNNDYVRKTARFRLEPATPTKEEGRTRNAIYGPLRTSDGTDTAAGMTIPEGRRWRPAGTDGARVDLTGGAVADIAMVRPSRGLSDYAFRRRYGQSRPGGLDPDSPALLVHTTRNVEGDRVEVIAALSPDAGVELKDIDDVAYRFYVESKGHFRESGGSRALMYVDDATVDVTFRPDGRKADVDEDAAAEILDRMESESGALAGLVGPY